jgi:hypothetical protein
VPTVAGERARAAGRVGYGGRSDRRRFYSQTSSRAARGSLWQLAPDKPPQGTASSDSTAVKPKAVDPAEPPGHEASGSVNRSSSPKSVRYMSVTIVVQRCLVTDDDQG